MFMWGVFFVSYDSWYRVAVGFCFRDSQKCMSTFSLFPVNQKCRSTFVAFFLVCKTKERGAVVDLLVTP